MTSLSSEGMRVTHPVNEALNGNFAGLPLGYNSSNGAREQEYHFKSYC